MLPALAGLCASGRAQAPGRYRARVQTGRTSRSTCR
jgi:hypothetical protein